MTAKLTIELDEKLLAKAQAYAEASGKTLSQVVAERLIGLEVASQQAPKGVSRVDLLPDNPAITAHLREIEDENGNLVVEKLHPKVRRLLGALKGAAVDENDYREHLIRKHS